MMGRCFVYSTATTPIDFVEYDKPSDENIVAQVVHSVTIKGGANLPDKTLVTPSGVVTEVSEADMAWLLQLPEFQRCVKAGHMRMEGNQFPIETVVNDMKAADGCAPLTPEDYEPGGRQHIPDPVTGKTPKVHSHGTVPAVA